MTGFGFLFASDLFLFASCLFCLHPIFFVCTIFFVCILSIALSFLFASYLFVCIFCLHPIFFVCIIFSVCILSFLFASDLFCLHPIFFVCSKPFFIALTLVGHVFESKPLSLLICLCQAYIQLSVISSIPIHPFKRFLREGFQAVTRLKKKSQHHLQSPAITTVTFKLL